MLIFSELLPANESILVLLLHHSKVVLMHISHIFDEKLSHVFFDFVDSVKLFAARTFDHHRGYLESVKSRAYVVEAFVHFVVVEIQTLEFSKVSELQLT